MNSRLAAIIERLPIGVMVIGYLLYVAFDLYSFQTDPTSPLNVKLKEIETVKANNQKLQGKVKEMQEFVKSLDAKRTELRRLAQELQDLKGTLSERMDIPSFMKTTITEAKKVGMSVQGLRPVGSVDKEFYSERTYSMLFQGAFVQLVAFLERLANMTEIVRTENLNMKPLAGAGARYVELEGSVEIKTYRYLGTKADKINISDPNTSAPAATPGTAAPANKEPPKPGGTR